MAPFTCTLSCTPFPPLFLKKSRDESKYFFCGKQNYATSAVDWASWTLTYLVDMKGQKMLGAFRRDILLGTDEIENDKELPENRQKKVLSCCNRSNASLRSQNNLIPAHSFQAKIAVVSIHHCWTCKDENQENSHMGSIWQSLLF